MMPFEKRLHRLFALLVLLLTGTVAAQQADDGFALTVLDAQTVDASTVSVDFVVDAPSTAVTATLNLDSASISVSEPAANLQLDSAPRLPMTLAVIIDMSEGSDVDGIKDTLRSYINNYYQPEDTLVFYILDGIDDLPRQIQIESAAQARSVINGLNTTDQYYLLKPTCELVYEYLNAVNPDQPRSVLHVGSFLNGAQALIADASMFTDAGLPYHVIQAHTNRDTDEMETLAAAGGGLFAENLNGRFVLDDGNFTPTNSVALLFDTLDSSRLLYTLTYEPTGTVNAEDGRQRTVDLLVTLPDTRQASASFTYEIALLPPTIAFANPAQLTPVISPILDRDNIGEFEYDLSSIPFDISVMFADGTPRALSQIVLEVFSFRTQSLLQTQTVNDPQPNPDGTYSVPFAIEEFAIPGVVKPVDLVVTAVDVQGFRVETRRRARVHFIPPPPPAEIRTQLAASDAEIAALVNAVTAYSEQLIALGGVAPNTVQTVPVATNWLLLVVLILIVLTAIAIAWVWYVNRTRPYQPVMGAPLVGGVAGDGEFDTRPPVPITDLPGDQPAQPSIMARLLVTMTEDPLPDRIIQVDKTPFVIGRGDDVDYLLDLPYVSPNHCRIRVVNGLFQLRDLGSRNGTYINGERIDVGRDIPAPNGSEIGITRKIALEIWTPQTDLSKREERQPLPSREESGILRRELVFKPVPGLEYKPDEGGKIEDDYSPV